MKEGRVLRDCAAFRSEEEETGDGLGSPVLPQALY